MPSENTLGLPSKPQLRPLPLYAAYRKTTSIYKNKGQTAQGSCTSSEGELRETSCSHTVQGNASALTLHLDFCFIKTGLGPPLPLQVI